MNIVEIASGPEVNGAVRHCLVLSQELVRRGHQVTLICRPGSWIAEQARGGPVEVVLSDLRRWPPGEIRRIAELVRRRRVDVIHTHMSRAHFFGVLLRWWSGVPCVATAHSRHFQLFWRFNDRVIAVSEPTRRYHQRWNRVSPNRMLTIPNFIEPQCLTAVRSEDRARARSELGIPESWNLLGAIGSVIPRKGLLYLVKAMPRILAAAPQTRLAIIHEDGRADYEARVRAAVAELRLDEHVLWLGPHNEMPKLFAAIDLCVLPSLEESLPLTLLEAMAAGLSVVATSVGGVSECVRPGKTGILVPPADSAVLGDAVVSLLNDPQRRRRFGEAARRDVANQFTVESQTTRIEAVLAVAARPRARSGFSLEVADCQTV
ncbi:MAG: glycosyltransferase family 4 protein [Thermoguttaceae bacterium]